MGHDDTLSEPHEIVAAEVRAEMARQQLSQQEMAQKLGVTQQTISRRLTGQVPFDVAELARIAQILNVPLSNLLTERVA